MSGLSIQSGEWVVVCDGAKALVLENVGDNKFPNLKTVEVLEHKDLPTREMGTDAPGRAHGAKGQARSAMEQTDWHDQAEQEFAAGLLPEGRCPFDDLRQLVFRQLVSPLSFHGTEECSEAGRVNQTNALV